MSPKTAWLLVPLLAVAIWLIVRGRDKPGRSLETRSPPVVTGGTEAPPAGGVTQDDPARPDRTGEHPQLSAAGTGSGPGALPDGTRGDPAGTRPHTAPATAARPTEAARTNATPPARPDDDAPAGNLTDRTGWSDASVGKQLNKEFMPLASECIDQARARKPRLEGLLAFTMVVAPTENGRVIVASFKLRPDNQIEDPELFECIRESSFALDGLKAPHDFDITMPIKPDGSG